MDTIRKNKKVFCSTICLILMILIFQICYADDGDSTTVDTISFNCENCNITVQKSENNIFQYDYNDELFELTVNTEENELKITAKGKENAEISLCEKITISIPNNLTYKKIDVQNDNAGIGLCEVNAEINIVSNQGATKIYVSKELKHNISYTGDESSCKVILSDETDNYSFNLCQENSAVSIPFSDYDSMSSDYTYVKGDGSAQININLKNSAFKVETYTDETVEP